MSKDIILVVEDDINISDLLKFYFNGQGYEVITTPHGHEALAICRESPPDLVLLDVRLPDMSGYDVGRQLRSDPRTRDLPIIVLTAFTELRDRIIALGEIKAQYFIGKPFDLEEVSAIVRNQLDDARRRGQRHPITDLPTAELVNDQLRGLLDSEGWTLGLVRINGFETFTQFYGVVVGEEVLKFAAMLLDAAVRELGGPDDFVGQMVVGPYFMVISTLERLKAICEHLITRFDEGIGLHYDYQDRRQGHLAVRDPQGTLRQVPLMSISVGVLTSRDGPFHDIRHLSESAEAICQRAVRLAGASGRQSYIAYGN